MNKKRAPLLPRMKAERIVTLAAALLVLIGGLLAVAAWRSSHSRLADQPQHAPAPSASPEPRGPLMGMTILVDPGHGGYDGGAKCRDSGIWEKEVNLAVAVALEECLTRAGAEIVMTRREDIDLCEENRPASVTKKRSDMQKRIDLAVQSGADMVLSIHMNEYRSRTESGPQVFYRADNEAGRLLAGCVQEMLIGGLSPKKERTAMAGDYFILQLDVPSVLVECGFISNAAEEQLLLDPAYQARLAQAIADGVAEYVRLTGQTLVQEPDGVL